MIDWLLRVSALLSQAGNMFILGLFSRWIGLPHQNQTISARCYENRNSKGWKTAHKVINTIFFLQNNHCYKSWLNDKIWAEELIRKLNESELNNLKEDRF
jgi:hypothetical protein